MFSIDAILVGIGIAILLRLWNMTVTLLTMPNHMPDTLELFGILTALRLITGVCGDP